MSAARLTALRLVGFKSFAERTTVEFGPGISAVVGPNGSGKSNLADALRWTLGEQGRSLRTRRSEDVIFAGSSSRRAIGMADVTLVIDNQDRLLPVDFGEVEIGRRLYRSGENEYLLNRQKIRLRDLVELLDAGNLADNAFLFIGQGMVDQALALRPEERRPLFEEAAGVRRHERRRRQAENELAEAESNLDRLRDVLTELRPQARRLAAQSEQLQARQSAGVELAEALLAVARARWRELAGNAGSAAREIERARKAADGALAELKAAEDEAAALSAQIGRRADAERGLRQVLDGHRQRVTELRVEGARLESELAAAARDRQRTDAERSAAAQRHAEAARILSRPRPTVDVALNQEIDLLEQQIGQIDSPAAPGAAPQTAADVAARRLEQAQLARRQATLEHELAEASTRSSSLTQRSAAAETERDGAARSLAEALNAERAAQQALTVARARVEHLNVARSAAQQRSAEAASEVAAARARHAALEQAISARADEGLARAARARGATLLGEGLEVDPRFRLAVSAALGHAELAFLVAEDDVLPLATRRGVLAVTQRSRSGAPEGASSALIDAAISSGGGRLIDAIRRDPQGAVTELLRRTVWLPDLQPALGLRTQLKPGWRAVTLAGEIVTDDGLVGLASGTSVLDQRAELAILAAELTELELRASDERAGLERNANTLASAHKAAAGAQQTWHDARASLRQAEEAERSAQRRAEQLLREANWASAQVERLTSETSAAEALGARLSEDLALLELQPDAAADRGPGPRIVAGDMRARLATLRSQHAAAQAAHQSASDAQRRAEVTLALDEARLHDLDTEAERISSRDAQLATLRSEQQTAMGAAHEQEGLAAAELEQALSASADERARLSAAEQNAVAARERLREAEARARQADVHALESRLSLEQTREQLLVELAGIGADGMAALGRAAGVEARSADDDEIDAGALEELLGRVIDRWRESAGAPEAPTAGRLAGLRRRFHDLGAGNPFAVEEYDQLRERLDQLEMQSSDMENAIAATRELISSLSTLINDQFRSTFAALEDAFARRFSELFGGGDAQLSLTAPDDLSTTGVDIHARPPGKKRQPLSMLSGGERALTAVSLLLAMLEVRPVPFCVLDEVDAALDEANVGRFSKALRGLAEQTQFIVITHNRGTIEGADALYGVTIGDDAVSRIVSLRLPRNGHQAEDGAAVVEAATR